MYLVNQLSVNHLVAHMDEVVPVSPTRGLVLCQIGTCQQLGQDAIWKDIEPERIHGRNRSKTLCYKMPRKQDSRVKPRGPNRLKSRLPRPEQPKARRSKPEQPKLGLLLLRSCGMTLFPRQLKRRKLLMILRYDESRNFSKTSRMVTQTQLLSISFSLLLLSFLSRRLDPLTD